MDDQNERARFEVAAATDQKEFLLNGHKMPDWILARADGFSAGWQAALASSQAATLGRAGEHARHLFRGVLWMGLNEGTPGVGFHASKSEIAAATLAQEIRNWLAANPQQITEIRRTEYTPGGLAVTVVDSVPQQIASSPRFKYEPDGHEDHEEDMK